MPTSPRAVDAECTPVWTASTSTECIAEVGAEAIRKHGMNFAQTDSRGKREPTQSAPQPRKGSQNLGFGGVLFSLSFAAERKGAAGGKTVVGKRGLPRARCALAMTWFLHKVRRKPGFRSSGRPTPVRRLPIDLRRAASPHVAPRQTQRFPPSRQASTSAERVADGDAETMQKQGANFAVLSSRG